MAIRRIGVVMVLVALLGLSWSASVVLLGQGQAVLRVEPSSLSFEAQAGGEHADPGFLTLANDGEGLLKWKASTDVDWITLGAPAGKLSGGREIHLLVLANTEGLKAGVRQGTITIEDPEAQGSPAIVDVTLTLRDPPKLEVSPSSLSFSAQEGGGNPSSKALTIQNTGGQPLSWTASENLDWLKLSGTKGTVDAGEGERVTVTVDVSGLSAGNNKGQILLFSRNAKNSPLFVDVTLTVIGRPRAEQPGSAPAGMVEVPGGSFQMGDSFNEGQSNELPVHTVEVSGFYMDKFEVTKGMWNEVASWASSHGYDIGPGDGGGQGGNHPVTFVTWYEAVKWANARSEKEGLVPVYYTSSTQSTIYRKGSVDVQNSWVKWEADGYWLPTEAEWEKAARGGTTGHRFPWSDVDTIDKSRANYRGGNNESYDKGGPSGNPSCAANSGVRTCSVGNFVGRNPRGPVSGSFRVLRGGSWIHNAFFVRVANRGSLGPGGEFNNVGFRLVRAVSSLPS